MHLSRLESIRGHRSRSRRLMPLVEQHAEIYRCIADRDGRGAVASMRRHLLETSTDLKAAFALLPAKPSPADD